MCQIYLYSPIKRLRLRHVLDVPGPVSSNAKAAVGVVGGIAVSGEPGDQGGLDKRERVR